MRSNPFDLTGFSIAELVYLANYQNLEFQDFLDLDISKDSRGETTARRESATASDAHDSPRRSDSACIPEFTRARRSRLVRARRSTPVLHHYIARHGRTRTRWTDGAREGGTPPDRRRGAPQHPGG